MEGMSKYGKEKGFSLRRVAFRLGDVREQLLRRRKTAKSAEPAANVKANDAVEGQEERPSTSSGGKSIGIDTREEEVV
jgi:hypothetical protein